MNKNVSIEVVLEDFYILKISLGQISFETCETKQYAYIFLSKTNKAVFKDNYKNNKDYKTLLFL